MLDSVIKTDDKYNQQRFLEECIYKQQKPQKQKQKNYVTEESKSDSDSNNETESDIDNNE